MIKWNYNKPTGSYWKTQESWNETLYVKFNEVVAFNYAKITDRPIKLRVPNKFNTIIKSLPYYTDDNKVGHRYIVEFIDSDDNIINVGGYPLEILNYEVTIINKESYFDDLKYIDYVIKFTNNIGKTDELILVCLNLAKEKPTLTIHEVIENSLFSLNILLDDRAGLKSSYGILERTLTIIKNNPKTEDDVCSLLKDYMGKNFEC